MIANRSFLPVQEAYFGKSQILLECESIIAKIIKKNKVPFEKVGHRIISATELNKSTENKKLEELFKKQFGFGKMCIHWDGSTEVNAFSFARGIIKLLDNDMPILPVKQNSGGYYDSSHNYLCVVNVSMGLFDIGCTAEEIVSIILHEIGHNFQCTPVTVASTFVDLIWVPINISESTKKFDKVSFDYSNSIEILKRIIAEGKFPVDLIVKAIAEASLLIYDGYKLLFKAFSDLFRIFLRENAPESMYNYFKEMDEYILKNKNKILVKWKKYVEFYQKRLAEIKRQNNRLAFGPVKYLLSETIYRSLTAKVTTIQDLYDAQTGYSGEVFADSFATAYGYGAAVISSQSKFNKLRLSNPCFALNDGNKYSTYNQIIFLTFQIMTSMFDPHPMEQTRIKNQINKLKRELDSEEIPNDVKKIIIKDLEAANKAYDDFLKMPPELKHLSIIYNFIHFNEMYFGGKLEIRDILNRVINFGNAEA